MPNWRVPMLMRRDPAFDEMCVLRRTRAHGVTPVSRINPSRSASAWGLAFGAVCPACLVVAPIGFTGAPGLDERTLDVADGARTHELLGGTNEGFALKPMPSPSSSTSPTGT